MLDSEVIVESVVEVAHVGLAITYLRVRRHRCCQHLASNPREFWLKVEVDTKVGDILHGGELVLAGWNLERGTTFRLSQELVRSLIQAGSDLLRLSAEAVPPSEILFKRHRHRTHNRRQKLGK
jgi:hypothetical protein